MAGITRDVQYAVPVYVQIEDGRITRVVVDDEAAELAEEVPAELLQILEAQEWPPWEFGY